ncbi:acylphosphatase [Gracilimonas sp.]|uniref:acylphosphatase n=1 Tax=Gracilimonas sp. TaxID=1974203 RepID=UPI00287105F3|nr:acylphosphatase [Gracilimonas sp.]
MKKHIFISGRVQGVGFRHFTKTNARELGVNGWVKNLSDGRVEAYLDGEEKAVKELIERCKNGPAASYVKNIEENKVSDKQAEEVNGFEVKFS